MIFLLLDYYFECQLNFSCVDFIHASVVRVFLGYANVQD